MVQRVIYRRRHCYATKSNKIRKVKTPGTLERKAEGEERERGGECGAAAAGRAAAGLGGGVGGQPLGVACTRIARCTLILHQPLGCLPLGRR